jgi:AraC-like DNA-binding protein
MKKANIEIRTKAETNGIPLWKIAERYGVSESYFCRLLRHELDAEHQARALKIIDELKDEG